jgi:hypothetical protein
MYLCASIEKWRLKWAREIASETELSEPCLPAGRFSEPVGEEGEFSVSSAISETIELFFALAIFAVLY